MKSSILNIIGFVLLFIGLFLFLPAIVGFIYNEPDAKIFLELGVMITFLGIGLSLLFEKANTLDFKKMILTTVLCWFIIITVGGIPYLLTNSLINPFDAFFESASGFTTTGATVFNNIEILSNSILFWRSLTHWIGGIGIIILIVAILPSFGAQAMQLFQTEVSGGSIQRVLPRLKNTAKLLVIIYLSLTALEIILLYLGGMSLFDSTIHSFGTIATGGFSSKNASIGAYPSKYIQYIFIIFMILSGVNFILYCRFIIGDTKVFFKNKEFLFYLSIISITTLLITFDLWNKVFSSLEESFRAAIFQTSSIITTTGFITYDFDLWPNLSKMLLFTLMFIGGCIGSTGGSIKVMRIYVVLKTIGIEVIRIIHPSIVKNISIENESLALSTIRKVIRFTTIYFLVFIAGSIIMSCFNLDMISAMSATAATLGNVGPGLGLVGAIESYSFIPNLGKLVLSILMILGRLEIMSIFVLFTKEFWSK